MSSMCSVYGYGLSTGGFLDVNMLILILRNVLYILGPVVILWGFIVTYVMNMIVSLSMAGIS